MNRRTFVSALAVASAAAGIFVRRIVYRLRGWTIPCHYRVHNLDWRHVGILTKKSSFGFIEIAPFLLFRQYDANSTEQELSWRNIPCWLEYCEQQQPDEQTLLNQPPIQANQTLDTYDQLDELELIDQRDVYPPNAVTIVTRRAVCERKGSDIYVLKLQRGCLWTMISDVCHEG